MSTQKNKAIVSYQGGARLKKSVPQRSNASNANGRMQKVLSELGLHQMKLSTWINKAMTFYESCDYESFVTLLEKGVANSSTGYAGYKSELMHVYHLLGALYVRKAYYAVGTCRAVLQAKATNHFNMLAADPQFSIDNLVCRGYMQMLTSGKCLDAERNFIAVLRKNRRNIPAIIGRACLAYNRQEYNTALSFFKRALKYNPLGPGDVRVGIAHCFLQLGDEKRAKQAFELALQHNGRCAQALLGLALLKFQAMEPESHREGMLMLSTAYTMKKKNPLVLLHLANHCFYKGQFMEALTLASNAYNNTDDREIQALSCFQIGRGFHAIGNFDKAYAFYTLSDELSRADCPLSLFGMAQINIIRRQYKQGEEYLMLFLKLVPNNLQAMRLLATLYRTQNTLHSQNLAIKMLSKMAKACPDDYDSWLSLALIYEQKEEWSKAQQAYERAVVVYERQPIGKAGAPVEWFNNIAALQSRAKQYKRAWKTFHLALKRAGAFANSDTNILTIKFNIARVAEELHRFAKAEELYKHILQQYPDYIDCYLRLGLMARGQHQHTTAEKYFEIALQRGGNNLLARTLLGTHYMKSGLTPLAMQIFTQILRDRSSHNNAYALIALGNMCLKNAQKAMLAGKMPRDQRHQAKAIQFFKKALEKHPNNAWAANGIGAVMCTLGYLPAAHTIFKEVYESSKFCHQAMLNMAHVAIETGNDIQACQTYKYCLDHYSHPNDVSMLLHLAHALFKCDRIVEAKLLLMKARHADPTNQAALFNLGQAIIKHSVSVFQMQRPTVNEMERAYSELKVAMRYFKHLSKMGGTKQVSAKQIARCRELLLLEPIQLLRAHKLQEFEANRLWIRTEKYRQMMEQVQLAKQEREEMDRQSRELQKALREKTIQRTAAFKNLSFDDPDAIPSKKKSNKKHKHEDMAKPSPQKKRARDTSDAPPKKRRRKHAPVLDEFDFFARQASDDEDWPEAMELNNTSVELKQNSHKSAKDNSTM